MKFCCRFSIRTEQYVCQLVILIIMMHSYRKYIVQMELFKIIDLPSSNVRDIREFDGLPSTDL